VGHKVRRVRARLQGLRGHRAATQGHGAGVGKALTQAVERYNQVVGSLESRVLPQARRFEALGVDHEGKPMPELPHIEVGVRPLARPEARADDGAA
jgi:DNA recombination protein RmuC